MFQDPTFWVAVAFVIFVIAVFKPIKKAALSGLDAKIETIRSEVVEAERLREEAQQLLDTYRKQQRQALQDAESIVARAKEDAERHRAEGEKELEASLERMRQQASDKIAQAEANAIREVRSQAVDLAIAATQRILAEKLDGESGDKLVDKSIQELPTRLQ